MRWQSVLSRQTSLDDCLAECLDALEAEPDTPPDFLTFFVSPDFARGYSRLYERLSQRFPGTTFLGCSAAGVIGNGEEVEFASGLSLTAGWLPGVRFHSFQLERDALPDLDAPPEAWRAALAGEAEGLRGILLLAEPFSFPGDDFLQGLDYAYPAVAKVGGLASGGQTPGTTYLFGARGCVRSGVVGVAFFGEIEMEAVVAQGCRPIGKTMVVTDCAYNEVLTLDGKVAGDVVLEVLRSLPSSERRLASRMLFLGIGAGAPKLSYQPGDFLIRQVLGVDPEAHALVVNAVLRKGQTVCLHVRDGRSSTEDLEAMLDRQLERQGERTARGGLLFSCLGRGRALYGHSDHDSDLFGAKFGAVPLGGFFCNGELGPVGEVTSLHSFTSCFAVFSEPDDSVPRRTGLP